MNPPQIGAPSNFASQDWWSPSMCRPPREAPANDLVVDNGTFGNLALAAASVRGHRHRLAGMPNQDAFSYTTGADVDEVEYLVAVVSDGVGSAAHAAFTARQGSGALAKAVAYALPQIAQVDAVGLANIVRGVLPRVRQAVRHWDPIGAGAPARPASDVRDEDLAATVVCAVVPLLQDSQGHRSALLAVIGDSVALTLHDGTWRVVGDMDAEPFIASSTESIMSTDTATVHEFELQVGDVLALCTDGIAPYVCDDTGNLALGDYLSEAWSTPLTTLDLAASLSFDLRSAEDDRTALLVWPCR